MHTSMRSWIILTLLVAITGCGLQQEQQTGTLIFTANGEDFVRDGFVSEDGWQIDFEAVYLNVYGPTAYQVVEPENHRPAPSYHGGHPHGNIPEGAAHLSLTGEYFLSLKQKIFELDRIEDAPIGNYNRLAFQIKPAGPDSRDLVSGYQDHSIILIGKAVKQDLPDVNFKIRFHETMDYYDCGPNGLTGVLAQDDLAKVEMTFHFDHIFGDAEEGPADPEDPETVNYLAIGFGPFANLAEKGQLDIDQTELGQLMNGATYLQLIEAVHTLGHSGEAHCHMD